MYNILISAFCLTSIMIWVSCSSEQKTPKISNHSTELQANKNQAYNAQTIALWRREKDAAFLQADWSPLTEFDKKRFRGLLYYEASPEYHVQASFIPLDNPPSILIETTQQHDIRAMRQVGTLRFVMGTDTCSLITFCDKKTFDSHPAEAVMSVYFKDKTNGSETYSGGRYIEIPYIPGATSYILDFNSAFNPYCAYNEQYSCPLVPKDNVLPVAIRAGEKLYQLP